jgi:hypothetical protein
MDLLIAGSTGHVLAAALRNNTAGAQPDAASLVGSGLLLRDPDTGNTQITLPAEHLAVQSVDERDDVLLTARHFQLVDKLPELKDELAVATPLDLDGTQITVAVDDPAPEGGLTVWVYIEGGMQAVVHNIEIAETLSTANEPLALAPGDYRALMLAPGYRMHIAEITVP